jgi:hypothetical protein
MEWKEPYETVVRETKQRPQTVRSKCLKQTESQTMNSTINLVDDGKGSPKPYTDYCNEVHHLVEANREMGFDFLGE